MNELLKKSAAEQSKALKNKEISAEQMRHLKELKKLTVN